MKKNTPKTQRHRPGARASTVRQEMPDERFKRLYRAYHKGDHEDDCACEERAHTEAYGSSRDKGTLLRSTPEDVADALKAVRQIFTKYQRKGGDPHRLAFILNWLKLPPAPRPTSLLRRQIAAGWQCLTAINAFLTLSPPDSLIKPSTRKLLDDAGVKLWWDSRGWKLPKKEDLRGRPKGPTTDSLIVAVSAHEFRRRFPQSCFEEILRNILILVKAVAPDLFPGSITTKHLRERINSVSLQDVQRYHGLLFS